MRLPEEYKTISNLSGPLMMVNKVSNVSYDELAEITLANGEHRRGACSKSAGIAPSSRSTREAAGST